MYEVRRPAAGEGFPRIEYFNRILRNEFGKIIAGQCLGLGPRQRVFGPVLC